MRRAFAAALALAVLAGCTKVGTSGGEGARQNAFTQPHVLRFVETQDIQNLNPHLLAATSLGLISRLTMAWLVRYGANNRPMPELLTVVPTQANGGISKDGKTITWHLRTDAKWSDGVPFTADDMVFSTNVVLNPKNNEIARDGWNLITKIDEPDKYTVVYHLKEPYATYLPTFFGTGGANPCLLPRHILEKYATINDVPYNSLPVGIGPFKYESWKRGESVTMVANPLYFRGPPKLQKIIWKIIPDRNTLITQLNTGEADMWPPPGAAAYIERTRALKGYTIGLQPSTYWAHLDFNMSRPVVSDVRVREALRYATDRKLMIEKVSHNVGTLLETIFPPPNPAHIDSIPLVPFDLAKARALLDQAGWVPGEDGIRAKNGRKLILEMAIPSGTPDTDTRVEIVRQTWRQVGADLNVKHYPPSLLFGNFANGGIVYNGKFDVTLFSWGGNAIGDYYNLYGCQSIPPAGQNVPRYCNRAVDTSMKKFKLLYGEKERQPYATFTQQQIAKDVPIIVLYALKDITVYNTDLKGWAPNTITPFDNMMNVDI